MSMPKKAPKESTKQIDSVDKALTILECFDDETPQLSLKQLSEKTGLYKSRILRLCGTLMAHGLLIRPEGSFYALGPKTLMLGKMYERSNTLMSLARPILREVAQTTGETTKLFVVDGDSRVCLVKEKGTSPLQYAIEEGERHVLLAGAGGKVLLAHASEDFLERILAMGMSQKVAPVKIDKTKLKAELIEIRKRGYAISKSELAFGVTGVAVPVFDHSGDACAALTITGATQQITAERILNIVLVLQRAALNLSTSLGYRMPVN